jgi:type IV pilus assembly protein PilW
MNRPAQRAMGARRRLQGFTLVELMVTVAIAIFLLFGLATIVQNIRSTSGNQALLAQLQDGQRLAVIMMTDVTQGAGYFPNPVLNTAASLPASGAFTVGQAVSGTHLNAANPPGDQLSVRYMTASGDSILNCNGTSNTTGADVVYTNTFSVNAAQQLVCALGVGAAAPLAALPLVNGVTNLQVLYGVKRNFAVTGNDVDTYLTASQMVTPTDWQNLTSVTITVTFVNPLAGQKTSEGVNQPATVSFTRVVDVMNRTGET